MSDLAKLRAQIAAGEYRVDADSIASALLDRAGIEDASERPGRGPRTPAQDAERAGSRGLPRRVR